METIDFITEIEVAGNGSAKFIYKIFRVGSELYLAQPSNLQQADDHVQEVYLEKDSEGWKHFTPNSAEETPESIAQQLLEKVLEHYKVNEKDPPINKVAF